MSGMLHRTFLLWLIQLFVFELHTQKQARSCISVGLKLLLNYNDFCFKHTAFISSQQDCSNSHYLTRMHNTVADKAGAQSSRQAPNKSTQENSYHPRLDLFAQTIC